jgi:hypothetical protein
MVTCNECCIISFRGQFHGEHQEPCHVVWSLCSALFVVITILQTTHQWNVSCKATCESVIYENLLWNVAAQQDGIQTVSTAIDMVTCDFNTPAIAYNASFACVINKEYFHFNTCSECTNVCGFLLTYNILLQLVTLQCCFWTSALYLEFL